MFVKTNNKMEKTLSIIALSFLFSCTMKSEEQPTPIQPQIQKEAVVVEVETYYLRLRPKDNECCPRFYKGLQEYCRFVGHDDKHVPKADVWALVLKKGNLETDTVRKVTAMIWWVNNKPYSDFFGFRFNTSMDSWEREYDTVSFRKDWMIYNGK